MSFQLERGLFLLDFVDHHAILGVPIDADIQTIRKRYLKVARKLHPDSSAVENEADKKLASEFLSKLVNPAWEKLSQEKDRAEYGIVLNLKGQQATRQGNWELGNLGKEIANASNPEHFYRTSLKGLADKQYEQLDQTLEVTGQISELNMVYLMRKEGQGGFNRAETSRTIYTGSNLPDSSQSSVRPTATSQPQPARPESVADQYYRRAEGYMAKNNYAKAVLELRDALQLEPKNGSCHALLGAVHFKQGQATMAKIHFNKALELDPTNAIALEGKQKLEKTTGTSANSKNSTQKPNAKTNKPDDKAGGGLFGLFGKKK
ncbi:tetratricopeptide repeat protein [Phormidium sp. CLA17]|uniref:J domain-containing protein n=1 Tax=Leptolyngbya sp. Cla-17 TaxID=2803751 RepID=UPI0014932244|nr:J domain-containing protein [Leptolyngbya sp. Cla-17]MBM0741326.1 tetratricopeptide repeat protein [Leptolyngbya sp. Cla-17]